MSQQQYKWWYAPFGFLVFGFCGVLTGLVFLMPAFLGYGFWITMGWCVAVIFGGAISASILGQTTPMQPPPNDPPDSTPKSSPPTMPYNRITSPSRN